MEIAKTLNRKKQTAEDACSYMRLISSYFLTDIISPIFFFYICTAHLDIIKVYYSPMNAQVNCLKNNIKIAPTCFGAVTPSSGSALSVLAKVTLC